MRKLILNFVGLSWLFTLSNGRFVNYGNKWKYISRDVGTYDIENAEKRESHRNQAENAEVKYPRLSEAEWSSYNLHEPNGPGTLAFGYDNAVDSNGNEHYRSEERLENGTVVGEYGYTDNANKQIVRVSYTADHRGYRANTQILPF